VNQFVSGAIMMASSVAGLFFLRFWRDTRDRFFALFAVAFWLLALERVVLVFFEPIEESRTFVYLIRSLAFILIVVAIVDKNRAGGGAPAPAPARRPAAARR
jgi:hypothetical protein